MQDFKNLLFLRQCIVVAAILVSQVHAAFEYQSYAWAAAAANIRVVGDPHLDRYSLNPSLMSSSVPSQFMVQYARPFNGLSLNSGSLRALHHVRNIPVLEYVEYFGDDVYSELALGAARAWSLDSNFCVGANLSLYRLALSGFESQTALTLSSSLYFELTPDIHFGSSMQHLLQVGRALSLPQSFQFGMEYHNGSFRILFSFEKEAALPMDLCFGLISSSKRSWQIACGYRDLSGSLSAGWRIKLGQYAAHYSWVRHPDLPDSYGFGMEIYF